MNTSARLGKRKWSRAGTEEVAGKGLLWDTEKCFRKLKTLPHLP